MSDAPGFVKMVGFACNQKHDPIADGTMTTCPWCYAAEAHAKLQGIVDDLLCFGWVIADPWAADWEYNSITVVDSGPICPVCGIAAPKSEGWPQGITMRDPGNHAEDCRLAAVLRERTP
jgi:hypothetical protein